MKKLLMRIVMFAGTSSNVKLQLQVDGFNWDQCSSVYQSSADVTLIREQLCAGGEARKDSCNGDSGKSIN